MVYQESIGTTCRSFSRSLTQERLLLISKWAAISRLASLHSQHSCCSVRQKSLPRQQKGSGKWICKPAAAARQVVATVSPLQPPSAAAMMRSFVLAAMLLAPSVGASVTPPPAIATSPLTVPHKLLMGPGPSTVNPRVLAASSLPLVRCCNGSSCGE